MERIGNGINMKLLAIFITGLFFVGCASSEFRHGQRLARQKYYPQAIEHLMRAELSEPDNHEIKRELGVVYCLSRQFDKAIGK